MTYIKKCSVCTSRSREKKEEGSILTVILTENIKDIEKEDGPWFWGALLQDARRSGNILLLLAFLS